MGFWGGLFVCLAVVFFSTKLNRYIYIYTVKSLHSIKFAVGQTFHTKCPNTNEFDKTFFSEFRLCAKGLSNVQILQEYIYPVYLLMPPKSSNSKRTAPTKSMANLWSGTQTPDSERISATASKSSRMRISWHSLKQLTSVCCWLTCSLDYTIASCFPCILASPLSHETAESRKSVIITHHTHASDP